MDQSLLAQEITSFFTPKGTNIPKRVENLTLGGLVGVNTVARKLREEEKNVGQKLFYLWIQKLTEERLGVVVSG